MRACFTAPRHPLVLLCLTPTPTRAAVIRPCRRYDAVVVAAPVEAANISFTYSAEPAHPEGEHQRHDDPAAPTPARADGVVAAPGPALLSTPSPAPREFVEVYATVVRGHIRRSYFGVSGEGGGPCGEGVWWGVL